MRGSKRLQWSADSSSRGTFPSVQDLLVSRERSRGSDLVSVPEEGLQLQVRAAACCLSSDLVERGNLGFRLGQQPQALAYR